MYSPASSAGTNTRTQIMQRSAKSQKGLNSQKSSKSKTQKSMAKSRPKQSNASVAYATSQVGRAPVVKQGKDSIRIKHREFITVMDSTELFTVQRSIALNPGLNASFPWLSQVAQAWEEYSFNSLSFEFITRSSTATRGSVIMTPDYDASDAPPASEAVACSYEGVQEDACWKDIFCDLPSGRLNAADKFRFVRSGPLSANQDIKLYDAGTMFACTSGFSSTVVPIGKLWVDYDVTLKIPSLSPNGPAPLGGKITSGGSSTPGNPFGPNPVRAVDNRGIDIDTQSLMAIESTGDFVVVHDFTGTVITAITFTDAVGLTLISSKSMINVAQTNVISYRLYRVTDPNKATIDVALTATTVTGGSVFVGQAPPNSLT